MQGPVVERVHTHSPISPAPSHPDQAAISVAPKPAAPAESEQAKPIRPSAQREDLVPSMIVEDQPPSSAQSEQQNEQLTLPAQNAPTRGKSLEAEAATIKPSSQSELQQLADSQDPQEVAAEQSEGIGQKRKSPDHQAPVSLLRKRLKKPAEQEQSGVSPTPIESPPQDQAEGLGSAPVDSTVQSTATRQSVPEDSRDQMSLATALPANGALSSDMLPADAAATPKSPPQPLPKAKKGFLANLVGKAHLPYQSVLLS